MSLDCYTHSIFKAVSSVFCVGVEGISTVVPLATVKLLADVAVLVLGSIQCALQLVPGVTAIELFKLRSHPCHNTRARARAHTHTQMNVFEGAPAATVPLTSTFSVAFRPITYARNCACDI